MSTQKTAQILVQLRNELIAHELWESTPPAPEALQSNQPFAVDTLDFHQWLQFIMIPELEHRIAHGIALPSKIAVSPMAFEVWRGKWKERRELIALLKQLDDHLSDS
ncbi:MAG: YqcC family protein [Idiomarina sp.]|nr:YqcC family protein [Idiomarina sp.]